MALQAGLTGLTEVVITVSDFASHLRLYCDLLGFAVRAAGPIPTEVMELWGLDLETPAEAMQLSAGSSDSGYIRLVKTGRGLEAVAGRPHILNPGLFDFDIFTWDVSGTCRELSEAGYGWAAPPQLWTVPELKGVEVEEGLCYAPDEVNLVFARPFQNKGSKAWKTDPARRYTEVTASVCVVEDVEREVQFWCDSGLGLRVGADYLLDHPGVARFLRLEPPVTLRMLLLTARGSGPARVELIQPPSGYLREDRTRQQRPGRSLGLSMWAFRVADIEAAIRSSELAGGTRLGGPVQIKTPIHGNAKLATVETPAGVLVEFYEPL